ncbi:methyl-accepting chemotaxis protein [Acuticoccus sp. M5D2P5]|uniref:methyl-accepting chemotaxis protein n=1 Tax=Acuticoccus kalidii TaxID=2910977 RepID=UPI001F305C01|nr:methyl-accepting chemotaxis protein [Acuticoccus kalidii]MCF3935869.1 methyl-accepting chemotaxis protein [Acuticoccus kalidii]
MSITRKVTIAFGVILFVTIVTSSFIVYQTMQLEQNVRNNERTGSLLHHLLTYQDAVGAGHNEVLRLINSSDIQYLPNIEQAIGQAAALEPKLLADFADDPALSRQVEEIVALAKTWRGDIMRAQLIDMRDPYTVDLARLRETSIENFQLWESVNELFASVADAVRARQMEGRDMQNAELGLLRNASIGASVILFGICVMMAFMTRGTVVMPLRRLAEVTAKLRDKDWGIVVTGTDRGDEIGDMSRALEVFRETGLHNEEVEREQKRTAEAEARKAEAVREAVDRFRDNSSTLLSQLSAAGISLGGAANSLERVAGDSYDFTQSCTTAAEATEASVQNVAAAIEEMSMSIRDISGQLQNVTQLTERTSQASTQAGHKVTGLKARSDKIHEVVDLITDIAGQINLLALNATIESARAGEAGKGFAVVAQQVKQLADQTAKATDDISRVIGQVSGEVNEVVQAIQVIEGSIAEVNTNTAGVAAAVEEQSAALDEISRNVTVVTTQTGNVANNVKGVESKVGETRNVAGEVSELSTSLKESSTRLGGTIEGFIGAVASNSNERGAAA